MNNARQWRSSVWLRWRRPSSVIDNSRRQKNPACWRKGLWPNFDTVKTIQWSNPADEEEEDDKIPPQIIPGNDRILTGGEEGDDEILSRIIPDDDNNLSDKKEACDRIPPQNIPADDVTSSEDQEYVLSILPNLKIQYSKILLFDETGDILVFNKNVKRFND